MKKLFLLFFLALMIWETDGWGQSSISNDSLYQLALSDLPLFAQRLTSDRKTDLDKAISVVNWFADNFNWTYTDYQQRSIQEILERKGGNCNELARVSKACLEHLKIQTRRVREVNLHTPSPDRQERAGQKVKEIGDRASIFGYRHNDHVWLELYDSTSNSWVPADPSLGVVGTRSWLAARYAFGKRYSLDPSSEAMIAPFAIFVENDGGSLESRTTEYAINGFNELYYGSLEQLPAWKEWVSQVKTLEGKVSAAFQGEGNLHEETGSIEALLHTYEKLKQEFLKTDIGELHTAIDAFSTALVKGEYDEVVAAYTEDARIFPTNAAILDGREAIRKYWTPAPGQKSRTIHHRIMPEEIKIIGNEAYDWGYYEGRTRTEDGSEVPWRGKYVIVWKKNTAGEWLIYLDIWNRVAD